MSFEAILKIVNKIIARKDSEIFREPVPWEDYGLMDYLQIVKVPMDLGTVQDRIRKKQYGSLNDCGKLCVCHHYLLVNNCSISLTIL